MTVGKLWAVVCVLLSFSFPSFAGVFVSSPTSATVPISGSATANSPVHFVATANSPACSKGVASIGIYTAPFKLAYTVSGSKLDTSLALSQGSYNIVIQEWDHCGLSSKALIKLVVASNPVTKPQGTDPIVVSDLQSQKGWSSYALLPPSWGICEDCSSTGSRLKWGWTQNVSTHSMDGLSTKTVYGGGTIKWGDVLWNNHLIGSFSSQGLPDHDHTLVPKLHNFTYDVYFWVSNASVSQAMEFDINQFVNGKSFIWGHECRIAGGHQWDVYDNVHKKWVPTGVACNPVSGAWNHLILQVERTSDDQLLFKSITLNGKTATINHTGPPTAKSWHGVTINYQLDGNGNGTPYTVYIDKLKFTMQ
jgi:hypothetical protein